MPTTVHYQFCVLFGALHACTEGSNYFTSCSKLPNLCCEKGSNYLYLFLSLSFFCLRCTSVLAHELQTSLLIKSDQWRIVRGQRRHELTNLACQTQCKKRGWGYRSKAVSASPAPAPAVPALCMQPWTNNRWGSISSLLFNGRCFAFPSLLSTYNPNLPFKLKSDVSICDPLCKKQAKV